jgi:hypothetical protein
VTPSDCGERGSARPRRPRSVVELCLVAVVALSLAGCTAGSTSPPSGSLGDEGASSPVLAGTSPPPGAGGASGRPTTRPSATGDPTSRPSARPVVVVPGTALAALGRLPVKGRAPMTGYVRALFGPRWADVDGNGCDTRNDILQRDLTDLALRRGGCLVQSGILVDPYTGAVVHFVRGPATSPLVQIDHVVALGDAWQKGAQGWTTQRRTALANDPLDLLAVEGWVNEQKGDGDAATWLPPRRAYRCAYVARQIAVKRKYGLWVTPAERDAMRRVLAACPRQPLPSG